MAVAKVQGRNSTAAGTTLAYSGAVILGNLLTCSVRVGTPGTSATCSDSVNGAWTQAVIQASSSGERLIVFYFLNTAAGTPTVTITPDAGSIRLLIEEWSGANLYSPVRATSSAAGTGTSISSGIVQAALGDLCYGSACNDNVLAADWTAGGTSAGGSWAQSQDNTEAGHVIYSQFVIATASGQFASAPTFGGSKPLSSSIVIFGQPAPGVSAMNLTEFPKPPTYIG